eukprot:2786888-Rhodomonas_salina.1
MQRLLHVGRRVVDKQHKLLGPPCRSHRRHYCLCDLNPRQQDHHSGLAVIQRQQLCGARGELCCSQLQPPDPPLRRIDDEILMAAELHLALDADLHGGGRPLEGLAHHAALGARYEQAPLPLHVLHQVRQPHRLQRPRRAHPHRPPPRRHQQLPRRLHLRLPRFLLHAPPLQHCV